MRVALTLILGLAACSVRTPTGDDRTAALAATDAVHFRTVLEPLMPQLREMAELSWGKPPGGRVTLRFLPSVDSVRAGREVIHSVRLDSAWVDGWLRRGAIASVCPPASGTRCDQAKQTLAARVATVRWEGHDRVLAEVHLWHAPDFGAAWEVALERQSGQWRVVSKRLLMIT